jgi:transposase
MRECRSWGSVRGAVSNDRPYRDQALDRTQPLLPMQPGQLERGTHDYKRNGTTSLFAALDLKTSRVISQFHQRHRSVEFRKFLDVIEAQVPPDLDVHLILDNYGTHKTAIIRNWLSKRPRFHVHFTPTLWLMAESGRAMVRRTHRCISQRQGTEIGHSRVYRRAQRRSQALRMDQNR